MNWIPFIILVSTRYGQIPIKERFCKDFFGIAIEITRARCSHRQKCSICKTEPYTYDPISQTCLYCEGMKPYRKGRKRK